MTELRDRYFHTLGFYPPASSRLEAVLARAYQQRSFEIEHYWKRATYFWGFQIAIFAAFGLLWSRSSTGDCTGVWNPVTVPLAALGFLTAVANSASARGSKFWQENWEKHIDMLEDVVEGRLYKTVWLKNGGVSFSVSGVNVAQSDCFVGFWLLVTVYVARKFLGAPAMVWLTPNIYVFFVALLIVVGLCWLLWHRTGLLGTMPNADGSHGTPICRPKKTPLFVRRYAPDEPEGVD